MKFNLHTKSDFNVWFSSDWHLNHTGPRGCTPLWQSRGYASASNMTDGIIYKVNELVKPTDYLFYLGDFCLDTSRSMFEENLSRIYCQNIYVLWGNHNSRIKDVYRETVEKEYGKKDIEVYPLRYRNLVFLGDYKEIVVDGAYICMCHYPLAIFNHGMQGSFMLHGHCHNNYIPGKAESTDGKILDVSWDGFLRPLNIDEIKEIMKKKVFIVKDHHQQ